MAIYRFSMTHGSRGKGSSSGAHARYILRQERYDYGAHQLKHFASGNMPHWAESAVHFWDMADQHEAKNARLYTELLITLPRELTSDQQLKLSHEFIRVEIGDSHPYTMVIHNVEAMDEGSNPHLHVMFTARTLDGIERSEEQFFKRANSKQPEQGGAPKERRWMKKTRLIELRESWERHANRALKRTGCDAVIDCRTLEAQGIERPPEPKLSPYEAMLWKQGVVTEKVKQILTIRELAANQPQQQSNVSTLVKLDEIADLRRSEADIGKTLDEQRKLLKMALSERETLDQTIERYDTKLSYAPGSREDAHQMAKDRLFGRALEAYQDSVDTYRAERDQIAQEIEDQISQGWGVLRDLPHLFQDSKELFEVQQKLNRAKTEYSAYVKEMDSSAIRIKCEAFGEQLYVSKMEDEAKRNQLVEDALSVRRQITLHETLIVDLEQMLAITCKEIEHKQNELSQELQMVVVPKEQQMVVGQNAANQEETQAQIKALKLQLALKLSLESDSL